MNNQPDQPTQEFPVPSDKLVLPAPPEQESDGQTYTGLTRPAPRLRRASPPVPRGSFFPLIRSFWRQEPALVLGLAIALVFAASIVLVVLSANTLLHSASSHAPQTSSTGRAVTSAPPTRASTLTVQMTDISGRVENGSTVHVQVQTSKPGLSVKLQVTYQAPPFSSTSSVQTTDGDGQATIDWPVNISSFSGGTQATVVVVATDQNGQQAMSDPVAVTIMTNSHRKGHNHNGNNN